MIVCNKHGEVELSPPDSNGNCYCCKCKEEIIVKFIESAPVLSNLANVMSKKLRDRRDD